MIIQIPEFKKIGENTTPNNVLNITICLLEYKINQLCKQHTNNNIDDIDGFACQIAKKMVKSMRTLLAVCNRDKDYAVANSIIRMLADNMATFKLIYCQNEQNEKTYRHYLYILDGVSSRVKLLPETILNDGKITKDEYAQLSKQINDIRNSDLKAIEHCEQFLNSHRYATEHPEFHAQTIKNKNWKYKTLSCTSNPNQNKYSWSEFYQLIDNRIDIQSFISSHLSQFVHGLSISNLSLCETEEDFYPIVSFGICIGGELLNELKILFNNDDEIYADFLKSPQFLEMLCNYSKEYIQENILDPLNIK